MNSKALEYHIPLTQVASVEARSVTLAELLISYVILILKALMSSGIAVTPVERSSVPLRKFTPISAVSSTKGLT
jgi:hypothetical protein